LPANIAIRRIGHADLDHGDVWRAELRDEITIHDSPGRDYVITADPAGDKPAANPAPQGKQKVR
jgi:hypothetical protein